MADTTPYPNAGAYCSCDGIFASHLANRDPRCFNSYARSDSDPAEPVSRTPAADTYPFFPYGYTCSNCNPAIYTDNPINTDTCPLCNSGQLECFRKPDSDAGSAQPSVKVPAYGYAATDGVPGVDTPS